MRVLDFYETPGNTLIYLSNRDIGIFRNIWGKDV